MKKISSFFSVISLLSVLAMPASSFAQVSGSGSGTAGAGVSTNSDLVSSLRAQIASLLAQVQQLQSQLASQPGQQPEKFCRTFNANLSVGSAGEDVVALNTILQKEGFDPGESGPFSERIASAVVGFQEKYKNEILTPSGLKYGTGYVGPATRRKLNALYGCGNVVRGGAPVISGLDAPTALSVGETGTWAVKAYDPDGSSLSYSVWWGDEAYANAGTATSPAQQSFVQTATFTHNYATAGTYTPQFTVRDAAGQSAQTSVSVRVGVNSTTQYLKVLSPNGGETWTKGTTQTIKWQNSNTAQTPVCSSGKPPVGMPCFMPVSSTYDIKLLYRPICTGPVCPAVASVDYTVANGVSGYFYSWSVGQVIPTATTPEGSINSVVPDGAYTVQVCVSGSNTCDSSDSYFKITSPSQRTILPATLPAATVGQSYHQELTVDGKGVIIRQKSGNLPPGLMLTTAISDCAAPPLGSNYVCNTLVSTSITGTPTIQGTFTFTVVSDSSIERTYTMIVNPSSSLIVLSPNGGETWTKGTTQNIRWQDSTPTAQCPIGAYCMPPAPRYYDLKLAPYYPPCVGQVCPAYAYREPYPIATNVFGSLTSYSWNVGKIIDTYGSGGIAPDGAYTIQICVSGSNTCDSSDSYFGIVSPNFVTTSTPN